MMVLILMKFLVLILCSKTMVFFLDDSVFGFNWKHIIHLLQMEQNALRSKLKLQEEELKYQKKILEIELKRIMN
jgi:hypothetical protein